LNLYRRIRNRLLYTLEQSTNRMTDKFLGVHTGFIRVPQASGDNLDAIPFAQRYHPSNYVAAIRAIRFVRQRYRQSTLVDLGCGAGRVLVLAAAFGYPRVVGVEIDPDLVDLARSNFDRYAKRFRSRSQLSLSTLSAARYSLPESSCTVFLFNPFDPSILQQFMERNLEFIEHGDLTFVCINPRIHDILGRFGFQVAYEWEHRDFSRIVRVYRRMAR